MKERVLEAEPKGNPQNPSKTILVATNTNLKADTKMDLN